MNKPRSRTRSRPANAANQAKSPASPAPDAASVVEEEVIAEAVAPQQENVVTEEVTVVEPVAVAQSQPVVELAVETVVLTEAVAAPEPETVQETEVEAEAEAKAEVEAHELAEAITESIPAVVDMVAVTTIQIEQAVVDAKETLENAVKATQDLATSQVEQVVAEARTQLQAAVRAQDAAIKSYSEVAGSCLGKQVGNGVQDICKTVLALVQDNIEISLAVSRELINAKTPQEALDVYSRFCQQQMDRWMQDSSRLSDMGMKLTEQAFASLGKKVG